jgi:hypothetical protein
MVWHERMQEDPVHRWLRDAVAEAARMEWKSAPSAQACPI